MPDNTPISLDSAVGLMTAPATPPAPAGTGAPAAEPEKKDNTPAGQDAPADNTPAAGANDAPADDQAAEGDDAPAAGDDEQPAQGDAPAATDGQDEQGQLPPLEPPDGWTADEKAAFAASPRKAQEAILRREQDRTTALRNGQNELADKRKAADTEVTRLKGLSDRLDSVIKDQVNNLAQEFPEIKTQADIEALAASDPARFSKFQAALMRFNANQQAHVEAQQELAKKQQEQNQQILAQAKTRMLETFPTWKDNAVLRKEMTELQDYAISIGASEQEARGALNPIVYKLAQKAMLYDRAQAQLKKAQDRRPAPVVKPGNSSTTPKADRAAQNQAAQMRKLDKSGDINDALSLMLVK